MAPRKPMAVRKKSIPGSVIEERRTKARSEGSRHRTSPIPPSPSASATVARSCAGKAVTTGRRIDFRFFEREGFTIGAKLQTLGWGFLCSLDLPTYPDLVRDFYSTLRRGSGGFICQVNGKEILVTEETLARILRMPREGPAPSVHSDRAEALRLILGRDEVNPLEEVFANQLPMEFRLLHNIIGRILFPKIGRFDFVSERDLIVMHCVIEEIPLNLPRMMMTYMGEAVTKVKASLPYGMVISLLLREFDVPVAEKEPKRPLRHTDIYSLQSLHRMGFRKIEGQWIRRGPEQRPPEEGGPSGAQDVQRSPSPSARTQMPPAASPSAPTSVPGPAAQTAPSTVRLEEDQLRRMASMIADELATRDRSDLESFRQEILGELRTISDRLTALEGATPPDVTEFAREAATLRARVELGIERMDSMLSTFTIIQGERFSDILRTLQRILGRLDQRFGGPSHQPDADASSQSVPAPAQPATSAAPSRPPRPPALRSGPASRTRSRVRTRSPSRSPPSVHLPDTRTLRVYSRSSRPRPSSPVHIPSDQD